MKDEISFQWKKERATTGLAKIDNNFFEHSNKYLGHLKNTEESEADLIIRKLYKKLLSRYTHIINDIIYLRTKKIAKLIINNDIVHNSLTKSEKEFKKNFTQLFSSHVGVSLGRKKKTSLT